MKAYVHYRNNKVYVKLPSHVMIQEFGVWVPAVHYTTFENPQVTFVRSQAEFNEKFTEIELPDQFTNRTRSFQSDEM